MVTRGPGEPSCPEAVAASSPLHRPVGLDGQPPYRLALDGKERRGCYLGACTLGGGYTWLLGSWSITGLVDWIALEGSAGSTSSARQHTLQVVG